MIPIGDKVSDVTLETLLEEPSYLDCVSAAAGMNAKAGPGARCEDLRQHVDGRNAWPAEQALRHVMMNDIGGSWTGLDGPRDAGRTTAEVGEVRRVSEARGGQALTCGILVQRKEFVVSERPVCV